MCIYDDKEIRFNTVAPAIIADAIDFSSAITSARIMNGSSVVASGATVTFDSSTGVNTIEFTNGFNLYDVDGEIEATLVVDIAPSTGAGDAIASAFGDIAVGAVTATDLEITGEDSNDDFTLANGALILLASNVG